MSATEHTAMQTDAGFVPRTVPESAATGPSQSRRPRGYDYVQLRMLEATKRAFAATTPAERMRAQAWARAWGFLLQQLRQPDYPTRPGARRLRATNPR